jgi:hypothetical protein
MLASLATFTETSELKQKLQGELLFVRRVQHDETQPWYCLDFSAEQLQPSH